MIAASETELLFFVFAITLMLSNGSPAKSCVKLSMLTNSPCLRVVHGMVFFMYYAEGQKSYIPTMVLCAYELMLPRFKNTKSPSIVLCIRLKWKSRTAGTSAFITDLQSNSYKTSCVSPTLLNIGQAHYFWQLSDYQWVTKCYVPTLSASSSQSRLREPFVTLIRYR